MSAAPMDLSTVGVFITTYLTLMCGFFGTVGLACPPSPTGTLLSKAKNMLMILVALVLGLVLFNATAVIYNR